MFMKKYFLLILRQRNSGSNIFVHYLTMKFDIRPIQVREWSPNTVKTGLALVNFSTFPIVLCKLLILMNFAKIFVIKKTFVFFLGFKVGKIISLIHQICFYDKISTNLVPIWFILIFFESQLGTYLFNIESNSEQKTKKFKA